MCVSCCVREGKKRRIYCSSCSCELALASASSCITPLEAAMQKSTQSTQQAASGLMLLLVLAVSAQLCSAGGYDSLIEAQEKRNQQLHERYLGQLQPGQRSFLDDLDSRVAELQARHLVSDTQYPQGFDSDRYWADLLGAPVVADEEAESEAAATAADRREEEPFMNKVWGSQRVSGGAGELGQVTGPEDKPQGQQVKTDHLPSYCDPPNPCPKHADPKKLGSPCDSHVQDTAEYNYEDTVRKLAGGQCPCDSEHMQCPRLPHDPTAKKMTSGAGNPYLRGNKRDKLDAKKSPGLHVAKRGVRANFRSSVVEKKNPWLNDVDALDTVEKKDGNHHHEVDAY